MQIDDNYTAITMIITTCSCFYFTMLEEYYSGSMVLPVGNGVTDGSLPIFIEFFVMGCVGNDFWRTPVANAGTEFEITLVDALAWVLIAQTI